MERKVVSGIMLTLFLVSMLTLAFNIQPVKAEPTTIIVPDDYSTIQDAINAASVGDTIYVKAGTYYENVIVNKSVSLIGENKETTIIDGDGTETILFVIRDNVTISGFAVQNGVIAIVLGSVNGNIIMDNNVLNNEIGLDLDLGHSNYVINNTFSKNSGIAISLVSSSKNSIIDNTINNNTGIAIDLFSSNYNNIRGNVITNNNAGVDLYESIGNVINGNSIIDNNAESIVLAFSDNNTVISNNITNNDSGIWLWGASEDNKIKESAIMNNGIGIILDDASAHNVISGNNLINNQWGILTSADNNVIYHNNFMENIAHVYVTGEYTSVWDDGYPFGGNYWSDYIDIDERSGSNQDETANDGIWDHSYDIDLNNKDRYPLVNPWVPRTVGVQVGDWVKYVLVDITGYRPGFPVDLNDVEWGKTSVQAISGTTIEVELLFHLKNGTEITMTGSVDVVTSGYPGPSNMSGFFISKNLPTGATLYATYPFGPIPPSLKINETIYKEYLGLSRETNHVNATKWGIHIDGYWDKATGVLSEYNETFPTKWSFHFKIVDTNIWKAPNPIEETQKLIGTIDTWNLPKGTENSLTSKLEGVLHLLDRGNENGALHKLTGFINQVEALRDEKLTDEQADYLVSEAQRILDLIKE